MTYITTTSGQRITTTSGQRIVLSPFTPPVLPTVALGSVDAQLTTLANLKSWINSQTDTDDRLLNRLIADAGRTILNYLQRPTLGFSTITEMISGRGERRIQLRNWPVLGINSLSVNGVSIPASTGPTVYGYFLEPVYGSLAGRPQNLAIVGGAYLGGGVALSGSYATFAMAESWNGGSFPRGAGNIAVNYSFGYCIFNELQTVPATVLLDQNGQPILDQSGNPIVDQNAKVLPGQPILDQNGVEILDQSGNPIIDQGSIFATPTICATQPYGSWSGDLGMTYASNGQALVSVPVNPNAGQYVPPILTGDNPTPYYQFAAADAGAQVVINYTYTPYDIEQACIEVAAERYRYRSRIGQISQSMGGQETASYMVKDALTAAIKQRLDPYKLEWGAASVLNVVLTGDREVIARFEKMPGMVHDALLAEISKQALDLQRHVVQDKLQGQVLNHITGKLQSSIQHEVTDSGSSIVGRVYSNNSVNYAAIHEFGGQIPDRYPVNGKAMHWVSGGQDIFAKFARGFTMPERSFLRSSLEDYRQRIIDGMNQAVQKATAQ